MIVLSFKFYFSRNASFGPGDHLTYSTLARNIVNDGVISHNSTLPATYFKLGHFPKVDVSQSHGVPYLLSGFFYLFGTSDFAAKSFSGLFFILSVIVLFLLGREKFDEKTAFMACLFYIFSGAMFPYIDIPLTEMFYVFLFLLSVTCLFGELTFIRILVFSILFFYLHLTRSSTLFYLPVFLCIIYVQSNKNKIFNVIFFLVAFALLLKSYGYFMLKYDPERDLNSATLNLLFFHDRNYFYEGFRALQFPDLWNQNPFLIIKSNLSFYISNYLKNIFEYVTLLARPDYLFASVFFLGPMIVFNKNNKNLIIFKLAIIAFLLCSIAGFSIGWPVVRYLIPVFPLITLIMSHYYLNELNNSENSNFKKMLVKALIGLQFGTFLVGMGSFYLSTKKLDNYSEFKNYSQKLFLKNEVLISNLPDVISWYADRKTIFFPNSFNDVRVLAGKFQEIKGIVITSDVFGSSENLSLNNDWKDLIKNKSEFIEGTSFKLVKIFSFASGKTMLIYKRI